MGIIKRHLTLDDSVAFVNTVVDNCFVVDEEGNDVAYMPVYKTPTLLECITITFTDYKKSEDTDENINTYMAMDLGRYIEEIPFLSYLISSIDETIEFRKQKLLNRQNNAVTDLVADLLKKQMEVENLQKEVLEQQKQINEQFTKEDMEKYMSVFENVNKFAENPDYLKAVANTVHYDKTIKQLQGHKKPKKKTDVMEVIKEEE